MANDDQEGVALERLAKLYSAEGRDDETAKCYETMLNKTPGNRDVNVSKQASKHISSYPLFRDLFASGMPPVTCQPSPIPYSVSFS